MTGHVLFALMAFSVAVGLTARADRYVALDGAHIAPYDDWSKASTNIQAALDLADTGETVWLSNGTFSITATLGLSKGVTLRGMGPEQTAIRGMGAPTNRLIRVMHPDALLTDLTVKGPSAQGALYVLNGTVSNCWVIQHTMNVYQRNGAGLEQAGGLVTHCLIAWNTNAYSGQTAGGIYMTGGINLNCVVASNTVAGAGGGIRLNGKALVRNALIVGNSTYSSGVGAGVYQSHASAILQNCTIAGNRASLEGGGGGLYKTAGTVTNCILAGNWRGGVEENILGTAGGTSGIAYSCAPELETGPFGNVGANPLFADSVTGHYRLGPGSPAIDAGLDDDWTVSATDLDGATRSLDGDGDATPVVDMGCYERGSPGAGPLSAAFSAVPDRGYVAIQCVLAAHADGADGTPTWYGWDFDNDGTNDAQGAGLAVVTNVFSAGLYDIRLTVSNASAETASHLRPAAVKVDALEYFVSTAGSHTPPYDTPAKAATNLRTVAEYVRADGSTSVVIRVFPGVYTETASVVLWQPLRVSAEAGPSDTAFRWLSANEQTVKVQHPDCLFEGFTVKDNRIGGVLLSAGTVSNCWLIHNAPYSHWMHGGGIRMSGGLVTHSLIAWNTNSTANNLGAGVYMTGGLIQDSLIVSNTARSGAGGGAHIAGAGILRNCLIARNVTTQASGGDGGGVALLNAAGMLESCTVAENSCPIERNGGGVYRTAGTVSNSVIYANLKGAGPQDLFGTNRAFFSCAPELAAGPFGNTPLDPRLTSDFRLGVGSPCIDAGMNMPWMETATDLAGNPRVADAVVDMGCYESQGAGAGALQISFSAEPQNGYLSVTSVLTAAAAGTDTNLVYFAWDFDDDGAPDLAGPDLWTVTNVFALGFHTVTLTVTNSGAEGASVAVSNLVKVYPDAYYVATNGTHVIPFHTPETAATNIAEVLDYAYADGSRDVTITVGEGEYPIGTPLVLSRRLRLVALGGPAVTCLRATAGLVDRLVKMSHPGSLLWGFTVTGGNYGGVSLDDGTVTNCWLVRNTPFTHWIYGGGLTMAGGVVTHCVIGWNTNATFNNHSAGVYMTGGLLTHSVIRGNTARSGSGGGIGMAGSTARVRNCLVFDNESVVSAGGGLSLSAGGVENVTVWSNRAATAGGGLYAGATAACGVTNCIVWANTVGGTTNDVAGDPGFLSRIGYSCAAELTGGGNGNIGTVPLFRAAALEDFRLQPLSPCRNGGTNLDWMVGATELSGLARIYEKRVDMGAHELAAFPGVLLILK